jgi:hypothetical protein
MADDRDGGGCAPPPWRIIPEVADAALDRATKGRRKQKSCCSDDHHTGGQCGKCAATAATTECSSSGKGGCGDNVGACPPQCDGGGASSSSPCASSSSSSSAAAECVTCVGAAANLFNHMDTHGTGDVTFEQLAKHGAATGLSAGLVGLYKAESS